ncbi:hypothetical protein Msil_0458 [Methylocella silvestris BL2]|uniref:DUF2029 domain-containing protein n=1 Tax=Methylocella silvestris (strain DSM 15510 / CIP 108128 / LMG 27833 / NCIMB 13906 / BL2) TaxID=395965 RepID=B8EJM8_METSB|nr:hypothetical protein [Methylocella silvestris]ACK49432.1 hypothetical protein Msil_0458 [Methylocella silvestris BL2]
MNSWRGRWPIILAIGVGVAVFAAAYVTTGSTYRAWRFLGVPSMSPSFADLRAITQGIDCFRSGRDPYIDASCDAFGRLYNYPSLWLHFGAFGISGANTNLIGAVFILLILASLLSIFKTSTLEGGAIAFTAATAPPVMLGLERGNSDMLIFSLIVLGIRLIYFISDSLRKEPSIGAISTLIFTLTLLKLYPIAGILSVARWKHGYSAVILTVLVSAAVLIFGYGTTQLSAIAMNTPQSRTLSYGAMPLFIAMGEAGVFSISIERMRLAASLTALAIGGLSILGSLYKPEFLYKYTAPLNQRSARSTIALASLAIFCFTFVMGSSWIYRLIFLLGTLPATIEAYDRTRRKTLLIFPIVFVGYCWLSRLSPYMPASLVIVQELLDWVLFAFGCAWLANTVFPQLYGGPAVSAERAAELG